MKPGQVTNGCDFPALPHQHAATQNERTSHPAGIAGWLRWLIHMGMSCLPVMFSLPALAQGTTPKPIVIQEIRHAKSPPLRDIVLAMNPIVGQRTVPLGQRPSPAPLGVNPQGRDPVVQEVAGPLVGTSSTLNFEGIGAVNSCGTGCNAEPSDTDGSVGATQYVQIVNDEFAVYDKATGALLQGPSLTNELFANLGIGSYCATTNRGDGIVLYDKLAGRWLISQFAFNDAKTSNHECIAVSTSSDATGSYTIYDFSFGTAFNDYPKFGVWPDAYYFSANMFSGNTFLGAEPCAFDRAAMLAGTSATAICFSPLSANDLGLLPSDLDGSTRPPTGEPNFYVELTANPANSLNLFKFHVDFTTPANSTFAGTNISVAPFTICTSVTTALQPCVPQSGTTTLLESDSDRLMFRLAYRNFGDHESLVLNHTVQVNSTTHQTGVRWYEIRNPNGTPTIFQQSSFAPDTSFRWMGSIAMDRVGDVAMGYSISSSAMHPSINYTGRIPSDPLNTMEAEATIVSGTGSQTPGQRWGDYSSLSIDPTDDCTFWYTTEYLVFSGDFNWHTRIGNFKFPSCPPAVSLSATSLTFSGQLLNTTSTSKSIILTNSGTASLLISSITRSGNFGSSSTCPINPSALGAGAHCTITVTFTPTVSGSISGEITITDNASNSPQLVKLTGTGLAPLSLSPASLSFGTITVRTTTPAKAVTLTNNLSTALTIAFAGSADYTVVPGGTTPCSSSLAAKAKCTLNVTFRPSQNGSTNGAVTIAYNANFSPQEVALSGSGTGGATAPLSFSPLSLGFAGQLLGTTSTPKTVTVTNNSTSAVTINSNGVSGTGNYSVTGSGSAPCPGATLAASGGKCTFAVRFSPSINGTIKGAVSLTDNSGVTPQIYNLSGTGALPLTFSPASLTFASQRVGTASAPKTVTVTNNLSTAISITIKPSGDFAVSTAVTNGCSGTLNGLSKCNFAATFTPSNIGTITGVVTVNYTGSTFSPQELKLTGTGQ